MQAVDAQTGNAITKPARQTRAPERPRLVIRFPALPVWCLVLIILIGAAAASALLPD